MKGHWAWHDGEMRLFQTPHPYQQERPITEQMKSVFLASEAVCWWCGRRQDWWQRHDVVVDHVAPLVYACPTAVTCKWCNNIKRGLLPTVEQMHRLMHGREIVRNIGREAMASWLSSTAERIFGSYTQRLQLLLAKTGSWDIRTVRDGPICYRSSQMCKTAGFHPPDTTM